MVARAPSSPIAIEPCRSWLAGHVSGRFALGDAVSWRGVTVAATREPDGLGPRRGWLRHPSTTCDFGEIPVYLFYDAFVRTGGEIVCVGSTYNHTWAGWEHVGRRTLDLLAARGAEPRPWGPEGITCEVDGERLRGELVRDYWRWAFVLVFRSARVAERARAGLDVEVRFRTTAGFSTVLTLPTPEPRPRALSVATLLRDEEDCLPLWLDYHLVQGVEHFYLYDNGSRDRARLARVLAPYAARDQVTLVDFDPYGQGEGRPQDKGQAQPQQMNHALQRHQDDGWLALIDVDEFLVAGRHPTVRAWLAETASRSPDVGAVSLACRWFGCGGRPVTDRDALRRSDYVFERLRRRREPGEPWHRKCVVVPARVRCAQVHEVLCRPGSRRLRPDPDDAALHHYRLVSAFAGRDCDCATYCQVADASMLRHRDAVEALRRERAGAGADAALR